MRINELRIGNWVKTDGLPPQEVNLEMFRIWATVPNAHLFIEAVPLTDEWLRKFGFVQQRARMVAYMHNIDRQFLISSPYVDPPTSITEVSLCDMEFGSIGRPAKYVHQLQNLYFSLTGEELKILS